MILKHWELDIVLDFVCCSPEILVALTHSSKRVSCPNSAHIQASSACSGTWNGCTARTTFVVEHCEHLQGTAWNGGLAKTLDITVSFSWKK